MEAVVGAGRSQGAGARTLRWAAILAASLLLALPGSAVAAGGDEDRAFELYQESRAFFEKGDFEGALGRLKEAWALYNHPAIGLKLADVYEKKDMPEEALEALKSIKTRDKDFKEQVQVRIRALEAYLQQPLKVSVLCAAEQTTVIIDHRDKRIAPFDLLLPRGIHVFEATAPGYRGAKRVVHVRGAQPMIVRFDLQPLTGTLSVRSPLDDLAGFTVILDGLDWKLSEEESRLRQTRPRTVRVGNHPFVCFRVGFTKDVRTIAVREADDVVIECATKPLDSAGATRTWAWVAAGGAVASAAGGAFLLLSYQSDLDKGERDNLFVETNKHIFGGVFLGTAVVLGVGSWLLFASSDTAPPENSDEVRWPTPTFGAGPHGWGAGATWRF